jgi:Tol biopolymer transport system component
MKLSMLALGLSFAAALPCAASCVSPVIHNGSDGLVGGRVVYQDRDTTDLADPSYLHIYDFAAKTRADPSWSGISRPRNGYFSPDGRWIVFTAVSATYNAFNVFVWDTTMPASAPVDLTPGTARSEDAKFSFDGNWIAYKRAGDIHALHMDFTGGVTVLADKALTTGGALDGSYAEASAPILAFRNRYVVFSRGSDGPSAPYRLSVLTLAHGTLDPLVETAIAKDSDAIEYYPILRKNDELFYARHTLSSAADRIQLRAPDYTAPPTALATNDCGSDNSDPAPAGTKTFIFSNDANGRYLLHLGNESTGKVWNFSDNPLLNAPLHDLEGSSYTPN